MKNDQIIRTIVNEKYDTGDTYVTLPRFQEMNRPELPEVGKMYLVEEREDVGPHGKNTKPTLGWWDDELMLSEGFPGNSDRSVRRFHGWRGTTDDVSVYAHGVRKCLSVTRREFAKSVRYRIVFGADQKHGEE